jgi:hypothetical protein
MKVTIAIDNGVSGSICILSASGKLLHYGPTPVRKCLNYTKVKEYLNRVDGVALRAILEPYAQGEATVVIERPMLNPLRWKASVSALRCDEATLVVLETLGLSYHYVDSRQWQTPMLPKRSAVPAVPKLPKLASKEEKVQNDKFKAARKKRMAEYNKETKALSLAIGQRLFPGIVFKGDADAAVMCEWARREDL